MSRRRLPFSLRLLFLFLSFQFQALQLVLAFTPLHPINNTDNNNTQILQEVLKEISASHNWDLESIKFSKFEVSKVRFGGGQRSEFRIRFGKNYMLFKFPHEVDSWNKFNYGSNHFGHLVSKLAFTPLPLDPFKLEGPFDLQVPARHNLSVFLPLNTSHSGLKRILVGEGITVEVRGAQEVSLLHDFDFNFKVNGSALINKGKHGFCPFRNSVSVPLLPVRIIGPVTVVAYRSRNPDTNIETNFLSEETVELLPEKCYSSSLRQKPGRPVHFLTLRIARLEKYLRSFLSDRMTQNGLSSSVRANVRASNIIRFQLELEKNVGRNETLEGVLAEWRTRPTVQRFWFEVMARVEAKKLKPLMIKKVRPFIAVDSTSWSNLMSNISFTKFPSILVPPEALTLDVKW